MDFWKNQTNLTASSFVKAHVLNSTDEHSRIDAEIKRSELSSDPFASAVRRTRMPMIITDPGVAHNPIVFCNDAFCRLTGYAREEILRQNCRFLQGPETNPSDVQALRDAVDRRVPVEREIINYKKNGEKFWNRLLISPVFDEDEQLNYFFASQFDVTLERDRLVRLQADRDALETTVAQRTEALQQSEARASFMLKAGRIGSWTLQLDDRRLIASELCKDNFGRGSINRQFAQKIGIDFVPWCRLRGVRAAVDRLNAHLRHQRGDAQPTDL